jgi:serine/threonine protein kinase/CheY-like chemotaxis protein
MNFADYSLLVVDDEELNRDMLGRRLERVGFRVLLAESGERALQMLQSQRIDMVLLDVMMPGTDGLEVLTTIRESYSIAELPVIMVTARDQSGDIVAALQLGANDYVTKPINFPLVFARVQTHLSIKQAYAVALSTSSRSADLVRFPSGTVSTGLNVPGSVANTNTARIQAGVSPFPQSQSSGQLTGSGEETGIGPSLTQKSLIVGDYEIIGELGRGGMGVVHKARHRRMNRLVALKVIDKVHMANPHAVQRFYQEIEAAAKLNHPNVIMAYDAGQFQDTHYFAMEYVEGIDLSRLVKDSGPLPFAHACDYVRQASLGLQHAFERGLVHRDIKPSNLLVTWVADREDENSVGGFRVARYQSRFACRKAVVKILDMGLARIRQGRNSNPANCELTCEGHVVGTADYMAPEQWMNPHTVDIRADLYSLGCTLYFLLAGRVPFPGDQPMEKMLKHNLDLPTPVQEIRPEISPTVAAILNRLMAKRPEERFQTPADLAEALR